MQILYGPGFCIDGPTAVAIGKFDGVHDGHIKIINALIESAKIYKLKSVIYTFDKNPKIVLGNTGIEPLMSNCDKIRALEKFFIDYLVFEKFDEVFSALSPEEFVRDVLVGKMNVKMVVVGENSTFGKDRAGDVTLMKLLGEKYGFEVCEVGLVKENGEVISSTRLREKLIDY